MKIIRISFIISFVLFSVITYSQENPRIKRSEFKKTEEGFKIAWKNLKEGDKYYKAGKGTYRLALEKYWTAFEYNETSAALNYKIGVCYLFTGKDRVKARDHLQKAYEIDPYVATDINYLLGRAYHLNLEFDKAIDEYKKYKSSLSEVYNENKITRLGLYDKIDKRIKECKYGMELVEKPQRVIIKNISDNINTVYDEYNSIFTPDYKRMYFTSRRKNTTKGNRFYKDNKFKEDIYYSEYKDEDWQPPQQLTKPINTKYNDHIVGLTNNANVMYKYNGDVKGGDILKSTIKEGEWTRPKKIKAIRSNEKESTMFLSPDEKTFYFVSDREDNSVGGKDIFYTEKDERGKWKEPKNLGVEVNTPYDEEAIFFNEDGDTLFFSSRGHGTMGGFDVFKTYKDPEGDWVKPINLGFPVNSAADDLYYKLTPNPKEAYLSSVRDAGKGGMDIFRIIYLGAEKEFRLSSKDEPLIWFVKPDPKLFYRKPQKLSIDTSLFLIGKITDANTSDPIVAKLQLIDMEESKEAATTISAKDGNYKAKLPKDKKTFGVEINATGYMFFVDTVNLSKEKFQNDVAIRNFQLDKVEVGAKMVLKNIYFDTGKATLKPESYTELNRVVKFLKNNPSVKIEVSGHTDNVGSYRYNKRLSRDRAKSVVEYLEGHEIDNSRLEYEGYAYDQPIASNATPEGRAQNRRVEFKILSAE